MKYHKGYISKGENAEESCRTNKHESNNVPFSSGAGKRHEGDGISRELNKPAHGSGEVLILIALFESKSELLNYEILICEYFQ